MARAKPPVQRLGELEPGQLADFFALLAERSRGATREGKPFYTCRFRDLRRTVTYMAWADGKLFEECESKWEEGRFYKLRATYGQHERYGPQIEIQGTTPKGT
jgi:3'-5' exoribonuclease